MFFVEMVIFVAFLVALVFAPNFSLVVICLFGIGLALGCDYPTAHIIISENIPSSARGKLVLGASRRHRGRLFRPLDFARPPGLALDVRLGDHSCVARHAWPSLHRRERQLAARARSG
jgi:hypothetical protein